MLRRLAVVAAIALAGCGSDSSTSGNPNQPSWHGGGSIPVTNLKTDTTLMKVVLNTTKLVDNPVTVYDGSADTNVVVTCASSADCAAYPGAICKNGECTTTSSINTIFYVNNFPATQASIPVPCDGKIYTVEVYGAKNPPSAGAPRPINESWVSEPVSLASGGCAALTGVGWTARTDPAFVFPTIYAGLGAPYDTYTVKVTGLAYPWVSNNWSLTYSGQDLTTNPTKYGGISATLKSPADTSDLNFTGLFHLSSSILITGESDTSWELTVTPAAQTPVGAGSVNPP